MVSGPGSPAPGGVGNVSGQTSGAVGAGALGVRGPGRMVMSGVRGRLRMIGARDSSVADGIAGGVKPEEVGGPPIAQVLGARPAAPSTSRGLRPSAAITFRSCSSVAIGLAPTLKPR